MAFNCFCKFFECGLLTVSSVSNHTEVVSLVDHGCMAWGWWTSVWMDGQGLGYFSGAVIKHHEQGSLEKEQFIWAYCSRGVRVHRGSKQPAAWWQEQEAERAHLQTQA